MRACRIRLIALALPLFLAGPASYAVDGLGSTSALNQAQAGNNNPVALNATIAFLQNNSASSSTASAPTLHHALTPAGGGSWGYSFLYDTVEQGYQVPGECMTSGSSSSGVTLPPTTSCASPSFANATYQFWAVWYPRRKTWLYAGYLYTDATGCTTQYNNSGSQINQWGCSTAVASPGSSGSTSNGTGGTTQSSGSTQ